ncbi:MAG: KH domain-containing protein [Pedosphaera sp.]|nr:KH domain-containing protein [Pedosphaera sp.]
MSAAPKHILQELLTRLGFEAVISERESDRGTVLDVATADSGRLIGRGGQTLADLQYLVNRLSMQQDETIPKVIVDVGGYRSQATDLLIAKAKQAAEKVRTRGGIVEIEPLNAFERRIIHNALADDPEIETHSVEVEGTEKKAILVRPKRP